MREILRRDPELFRRRQLIQVAHWLLPLILAVAILAGWTAGRS